MGDEVGQRKLLVNGAVFDRCDELGIEIDIELLFTFAHVIVC